VNKEHEKTMIAVEALEPRKGNRSIGSKKENLDGLVASIQEKGIINALIVRPFGKDSFEIVCGHRRWMAAEAVGLKEVPCDVRSLSDAEAEEIAAIDNLQREDLHPLDEAAVYDQLARKLELGLGPEATIEQVAARVGKQLPYVRARMKLLALSPKARLTWLEDKNEKISLGHALVLCRYPVAIQDQLVSWIVKEWRPPTVKDLQEYIANRIHVELSKAPFLMDDANLLPQAGACLACPKRTGADRLLFPEVGKKDLCLDPKCFQAKVEADMKKRISELKESGEPYYLVSGSYDYGEKLPTGALHHGTWRRAGKGEAKDAVKCLVVSGEGKGSIVMGFKDNNGPGSRQTMTPKEKEKRKAQILKNRIDRQIVTSLLDQTLVALGKIFENKPAMPEGFTRMVAYRVFDQLYGHNETKLCKALGWQQTKERGSYGYSYSSWAPSAKRELAKMALPEVHLFIARCLLAGSYPPDPQDSELLRDLAILANIDPKKVETTVRAEFEAKAKSKGPKLTNISADGKAAARRKAAKKAAGVCSVCGCTDKDCSQCIKKTGEPCHWVNEEHTLCSACADNPRFHGMKPKTAAKKTRKKDPEYIDMLAGRKA
jgi:ParB family chromosome partitioning protein